MMEEKLGRWFRVPLTLQCLQHTTQCMAKCQRSDGAAKSVNRQTYSLVSLALYVPDRHSDRGLYDITSSINS